MKHTLRVACAMVVVVLAGLGPTRVGAAGDAVTALGPGAVRFDLSHDAMLPLFVTATDSVVIGQSNGAGCDFPSRLRGVRGGGPQGEMTLAVNNDTCRALVRAGSLAALPPGPPEASGGSQVSHPSPAAPGGAGPCSSVEDRIWQTDPVN